MQNLKIIFALIILNFLNVVEASCNTSGFLKDALGYSEIEYYIGDINDVGQMLGQNFIIDNSIYKSVNFPGAYQTFLSGFNNIGQIVGQYYINSNYPANCFIYDNGVYSSIRNYPGASNTAVQSINDGGDIVGYYNIDNRTHSFIIRHGVYSSFDYPGALNTWAHGINNEGLIVGTYNYGGWPNYGFIKDNNTFISFAFPGAFVTEFCDINNFNQIIMVAWSYVGGLKSYVKDNASYNEIIYPGSSFTNALGINDAGQIVGHYQYPDPPVPETPLPGALILFASGCALLLYYGRKQTKYY